MNLYNNDELVEAAELVLTILQDDPEAQQQLAAYGCGPAQRQEGKKRLEALEKQVKARTQLEHERWALSQQVNAGLKAVHDQLRNHAHVARFALREDPDRLRSLQVETFATRQWEGVRQAIFFYEQLQQQELSLEAFGLPKKVVQQSLAGATQLLQQKKQRTRKGGLAQQRTQEFQQALVELRDWVVEFRSIARTAYRRQPQMLEMYGIHVRSTVKG